MMYETYIFIFNLMFPSFGRRSHAGNLTFLEFKHGDYHFKNAIFARNSLSSKAVYPVSFLHLVEIMKFIDC